MHVPQSTAGMWNIFPLLSRPKLNVVLYTGHLQYLLSSVTSGHVVMRSDTRTVYAVIM